MKHLKDYGKIGTVSEVKNKLKELEKKLLSVGNGWSSGLLLAMKADFAI